MPQFGDSLHELKLHFKFFVASGCGKFCEIHTHTKTLLLSAVLLAFTCSTSTIETVEKRGKIFSKLTIKTERRHRVFLLNFDHIWHVFLGFYCWLWTGKCQLGVNYCFSLSIIVNHTYSLLIKNRTPYYLREYFERSQTHALKFSLSAYFLL